MNYFIILCALLTYHIKAEEKPFVVVIPSYNNIAYYERNLDSVLTQKYENYRVIYINDASNDLTGSCVQAYLDTHDFENRVTLVQNSKRVGSLANKYRAIWLCDAKEIVVDLDGDDWLAHPDVLSHLNEVYSDPNVWVTYGQFIYHPWGSQGWAAELPFDVIANNSIREYPWRTTHLRTFYAGLFHKINKEDLYFKGDFFPMAGDLAYMFPILEMASVHSHFIPEILYVYNFETPLNDGHIDSVKQEQLGFEVRKKTKYQPVRSPF